MTHLGYDFGWVQLSGEPRHVYVAPNTQRELLSPAGHPASVVNLVALNNDDSWVTQRIAAGGIERSS